MLFKGMEKEFLNSLISRFLAPYTENLDVENVATSTDMIEQGIYVSRDISLKSDCLQRFNLPVHTQGIVRVLTLTVPWQSLGKIPMTIHLDGISITLRPSDIDQANEADRTTNQKPVCPQTLVTHPTLQGEASPSPATSRQGCGITQRMIDEVLRSVKIIIANVHVRYEDQLPFSSGLMVEEIHATTVDESLSPQSPDRLLAWAMKVQALALYVDTTSLCNKCDHMSPGAPDMPSDRRFILEPFHFEAKIAADDEFPTAKFIIEIILDRASGSLDDEQYRTIAEFINEFRARRRRQKNHSFWPNDDTSISRARRRLIFAGNAILSTVREHTRRWTWKYFAERRMVRRQYIRLFRQQLSGLLTPEDAVALNTLDKMLSSQDLRLYRYLARAEIEELSRSSKHPDIFNLASSDDHAFSAVRLHDPIPAWSVKVRISDLSASLRTNCNERFTEIMSVSCRRLSATILQEHKRLEASVALDDLLIFEHVTKGGSDSPIVRFKESGTSLCEEEGGQRPPERFLLRFEHHQQRPPRADLSLRLHQMELLYYQEYVAALLQFFNIQESHQDSSNLDAVLLSLDGLQRTNLDRT